MNLARFLIAIATFGLVSASDVARSETLGNFDVLIRGGLVVDGLGTPPRRTDIGIRGDRIVFVGDAGAQTGARTIDATGLVVAPGFIDAHNHAEELIDEPANRLNENSLVQGVTTIVGSPDGGSSPAELAAMISAFQRNGIGSNYAFYVGHNGIRRAVMGDSQQRAPTETELAQMRQQVREGMEMGALGLSTGLMYEPGMFSTTEEVVELTREIAPYDGLYDTHTRDPAREMVASEAEGIEIGRLAGVRVKLGHLKAVGLINRGRIGEVIALVNAARAAGREVVADQYLYDGAATAFLNDVLIVPDDPRSGRGEMPLEAVKAALRDPARRELVRQASENGVNGGFSWIKIGGYNTFRIVDSPSDRGLEGQFIQTRAEAAGRDPFSEIVELILASEAPILITLGAVDEADVRELLRQPWVMIASDGEYVPPTGAASGGHPRSTGAFARALGLYVREARVIELSEAVRRMTSFPAEFLRLRDRGQLTVGYAADVAVFDPDVIAANSTWTRPELYATGVRYVLVNGRLAVDEGNVTGEAAGRVLRRTLERPASANSTTPRH